MKRQLRLLKYVWPHWHGLLVVLATMLMGIGLDLLQPWPTKLLVDQVLGHHPVPPVLKTILAALPYSHGRQGLLLWVVISTVMLFLAGTLIGMFSTFVSVGFNQRMTYDLGADLFLHLQRLSLLFHSRRQVGDTISRVTGDPYCIQTLVGGALIPLVQSIITLITMFFIMWHLNRTMTLLSLTVVPFLILAIRVYGKPMQGRTRVRRDLEGQMMSVVQQALSAIPAVQAFTREEQEYSRFRGYADATVTAYVRTTASQTWFKLCVGLVSALGTAGIMYLGGLYALQGQVTVGTILVFLAYLGSLYGPLNSLAYMANSLQASAANADRIFEILDTPIDVQDAPHAVNVRLRGEVRYRDVTFGYEPGRPVLKQVSFEAMPGEVIAIVGPTGAGKTTLVNHLVRFFDPWSGQVCIDGYDVRDLQLLALREQVAIVLQEPFIFPYTIAENIAYGRPDASREDIEAAAIAANADEFIQRLPQGYDTVVGERGATLSGGEKQRLSIARAFLKDAPILILDEPTSALDARTEARLLDALERLMKGRTTLIIAHRLSTIRNADRILVVDHGEIVEQGRHDDLVAHPELYASLYNQQMSIVQHDVLATAEIPAETERVPGSTSSLWVRAPAGRSSARVGSRGFPDRARIVLLGMMGQDPFAGVALQVLHYLEGFHRIGCDVFYVEDTGAWPYDPEQQSVTDDPSYTVRYIAGAMSRLSRPDDWVYRSGVDGRIFNMTDGAFQALFQQADALINLSGATVLRDEHMQVPVRIYLETDPVTPQIEIAKGDPFTIDLLRAHTHHFTFGENIGALDCGVPLDGFTYVPTRQPVLLDWWPDGGGADGDGDRKFTTIANWKQTAKDIEWNGTRYGWSKHEEFLKVIDLPRRTSQPLELALAQLDEESRALLGTHGWSIADAVSLSREIASYCEYVANAAGEFTVAKDQNVRLRSGWFSDRSASFLAAGKPVVTQDTGFGNFLPTGDGLFAFRTVDEAAAALEEIRGDYRRHSRAARDIAGDCFRAEIVLRKMLDEVGL